MSSTRLFAGVSRALVIISMLLVCGTPVLAASYTPAGTLIRNQASATFLDAALVAQTALSNEVITTVLPIYGVTVTPNGADGGGQARNGTAGSIVYLPYLLTNAGNDNDKYTITLANGTTTFTPQNPAVYEDTNGNGEVDPGDVLITLGGQTRSLSHDEQITLILTYSVPAGATAGQKASVNLKATSFADTDRKDEDNFGTVTVVSDAVVTATKSVTPRDISAGAQVTYTIGGTNTGSKASKGALVSNVSISGALANRYGVLIYDTLPSGQTFNSMVAKAPADAVVVYESTEAAGAWTDNLLDNANRVTPVTKFALFIPASPNAAGTEILAPGQAYQLRVRVDVAATQAAGSYTNTAHAKYANNSGTEQPIVDSNPAILNVGGGDNQTVLAALGPQNSPEASELNDPADVSTSDANRPAGSFVTYTVTLKNGGNGTDTFNLNVVSNGITTTGSTVQFLRPDGTTALADSNSDGLPDSGPLAAGATTDLVVKVFIPAAAPTNANNIDVQIRARSVSDTTKTNNTILRVAGILGAGALLGNHNGVVGTVSTDQVTKTTSPGNFVDFPLDVVNNGGSRDTYKLRSTLPSGFLITYYMDSNANGVLDASEQLPIADTGVIVPGSEVNLIARVTVPSGTAAGNNNVVFTAASTNDPSKVSSQTNVVAVVTVRGVTVQPNRSGIGIPGGTVTFRHTVLNTGTLADSFALTVTNSIQGWNVRFQDTNGNPIVATATLQPGDSEEIAVVRFVPDNQPINTVEQFQVVATGTVVNAVPVPTGTALDTISVINGNLELTKSVANETTPANGTNGKPGETMVYTVTYRNLGNAAITSVMIFDAIPFNTQYVALSKTGTNPAFSTDNGATYGATGVEPGTPANTTNIRWSIGSLGAGVTGTVTFKVTIK
jgi:uncharacterized repeat protein (TIGR01451 family)